ncbi:hypothetical protein OHC33_011202 [Knufia fluminis]|uniref:3-hydroxyisobutyrate dehydrogenase n=1 Tax=Knufia fluminis TaxID=191047 RepID=A0AAN8EEJ7_9EURO|nr:hypothetical protein OHC33_011202 [Knufia fluminis]
MSFNEYRNVGFIGLGVMGLPMAKNLARKLPDGTKVAVYDLSTAAMDELSQEFPNKIVKANNAREVFSHSVSRSYSACTRTRLLKTNIISQNLIVTMLPEGKHVSSVYMSSETQLDSVDLKNKILIDSSTIDVETSLAVADHVAKIDSSALFCDAPVSGQAQGAIDGTLAFFLGISESHGKYKVVSDLVRLMGNKDKVLPCGGPSLGLVAKISHNYLAGVMSVATCETMDLGIRAGLDPKMLYRVLCAGAARNPMVEHANPVPGLVPTAASSNGYKPGFRASLMAKDVSLGVQMAQTYKSNIVLGAPTMDVYRRALPKYGGYDFTAIYRLYADDQNGIQ